MSDSEPFMPGLDRFHANRIRMVETVLGEKVLPRDDAMIACLAGHMEKHGWHSVSINPGPNGYSYIIQPQSQWERDRRQQAKESSAQPQPVPAATSAAAPPVATPAAAAAPAAAPQATRSTNRRSNPGPTSRPRGGRGSGRAASRTGSP